MTKPLQYASSVLNLFVNYSPLDLQNFLGSSLAEKIRERDFGFREVWTKVCNDGLLEKIEITVADAPYNDEAEKGYQVRCWAEKNGRGRIHRGLVDTDFSTCPILFELRLSNVRNVVSDLAKSGISPPPGFAVKTEKINPGEWASATILTFVKEHQEVGVV